MRVPMVLATTALALSADPAAAQDLLARSLEGITSTLGTYLAALAGTSGLVVALMEAGKKIFSIRGKFHRTAVIRWLSQETSSIPKVLSVAKPGALSSVVLGGSNHFDVAADRQVLQLAAADRPYRPARAYAEFFHLTSGQALPEHRPDAADEDRLVTAIVHWRGVDRAVFELDTSRMLAQIQEAADAVLNHPARYPHLYAFFTRGVTAADASAWQAFVEHPSASGATKEQSDLYGRIRMLVRRQLDAFQTVTSCRWDDLNQWWAMLFGAVILFVALLMAADPHFLTNAFDPGASLRAGAQALAAAGLGPFLGLVLKAALGGALAPLAKDLLNNLSSLKFTK